MEQKRGYEGTALRAALGHIAATTKMLNEPGMQQQLAAVARVSRVATQAVAGSGFAAVVNSLRTPPPSAMSRLAAVLNTPPTPEQKRRLAQHHAQQATLRALHRLAAQPDPMRPRAKYLQLPEGYMRGQG